MNIENTFESKEQLKKYYFFLGGEDLEMREIKTLLDSQEIPYQQTATGWGAESDEFEKQIKEKVAQGYIPVKIELAGNIEDVDNLVDIDHHNDQSTIKPASILQVYSLLGIKPDRRAQLVAINDAEYSHGLLKFGATLKEIEEIRKDDRATQGITSEQEDSSQRAFQNMEIKDIGDLKVGIVDNMSHSKFTSVSDRAFTSGDVDCLICIYRNKDGNEIQFEWVPRLCKELGEKYPYPQSWYGRNYWGSDKLDPDKIKQEISDWLMVNGSESEISQPNPRFLNKEIG